LEIIKLQLNDTVGEIMDFDRLLLYEKKHKLFEREDDGFKYWPYLRFEIFNMIQNKNNNTGAAHTKPPFINRVKELYKIPFQYFNASFLIKKKSKELDYLILNHQRRVKEKSIYRCLYTDNLISHLEGGKHLIIEEPYEGKHFKPIINKDIMYVDYLDYLYVLKRLIYSLKRKKIIHPQTENELRFLVNELSRTFDAKLNANEMIEIVNKMKIRYTILYKHYKYILKKINPKVVIEVVSYNFSRMVVNEICKELNIPTIELQHGTMGKYHIAYNFAEKMNLETFPDYIFTFGQFWKDSTRLPLNAEKVKVIGWPYFEQKVNEFNNRKEIEKSSKKTILFISQGTIGKELSQLAVDLSKIIGRRDFKIIYKLHPGEYIRWKGDYPWLINANLEVVDHNNNDMHYYFSKSEIQIGVYSTALFEGLAYGLKTIIVKLSHYETMELLFKERMACLAETSNEVFELCKEFVRLEKKLNVSYFWEQNSMSNMLSEIDKVIKMRDEI
jgi:hypothetical protein